MRQNGLTTGSSSAPIDKLRYTYYSNTNRLKNVVDTANDAATLLGDFHYPSMAKTVATVDYTYDANGNMISDGNKNISAIVYNYLNLPEVITVAGKGRISYSYDAAGNKLKKETVESTQTPARTTTTLYIGNSVYRNDTLQFFGMSEGRIRPNGTNTAFVYDYFLKDHLGNTRMVITDDYNVASPILEATSYYPFGLTMSGISSQQSGSLHNKYLYNKGSELQEEFGLDYYDTHLRQLDPQLGRWWQLDPKPDYTQSSYSAMNNNPMRFNDPLGDTLRPLTTNTLRSMARQNGFTGTGVVFNRKVGKAFESIGLGAAGFGEENKKQFTSSARAKATAGSSSIVIPGGVRSAKKV